MEKVKQIFAQFERGVTFKSGLGTRGMYEQSNINERFFLGDQWYGAGSTGEKPLVRHNVIRRIGDYKISYLLQNDFNIKYRAAGIGEKSQNTHFSERENGIFRATNILTKHLNAFKSEAELELILQQALRQAFISGTGIVYTYWDENIDTGLSTSHAPFKSIKGGIAVKSLNAQNVYFASPFTDDINAQEYIIIAAHVPVKNAIIQARQNGATATTLKAIERAEENGYVLTLTKLYKTLIGDKTHIMAVKVCKGAVIKNDWDTLLCRYPISLFLWEKKGSCVYGESEITHLIPNQIAINRLITANVWSGMMVGMPLMVVNGDTVNTEISNEPGQIIKVYGTNEDVSGAVKYISPPDYAKNLQGSVDSLIQNTLYQSGANEAALGDMDAENATAIARLRSAAMLPMEAVKSRYKAFLCQIALNLADCFIAYYGRRSLIISDENRTSYLPFDAGVLKGVVLNAVFEEKTEQDKDAALQILNQLYEKGELSAQHFIENLPDGIFEDKSRILAVLRGKSDEA